MSESLRLGHIAGIRVGINWSVLVIFLLITVGLAAGRFPLLYPDLPVAAYVVAGLAAGVLFFLSLLSHEMGHAIVARRNGMGVEGITLWLFGGVAKLTDDAPDAGADLRVAGVGPLISLLLAAVFLAVAAMLSLLGFADLVVGVFGWLALINVILAVFNLIPAAPLDGGRILRAFLWSRRGDRYAASITASRAGRTFGWMLIGLGIADFVFGTGGGGIWLALIGWFITTAAGAEEQHARITGALGGISVREVMSPDPSVVPGWVTVQELLDSYLFGNRYSSFPVVDQFGEPVGLLTLNRVKQVPADRRSTVTVEQVACPRDEVVVASPDEMLTDVLPRLSTSPDGRALVLDHGALVGIISPTDVMRQMQVAELRGTFTASRP